MIKETTIYDFKTNLSKYIAAGQAGSYEKIIVKNRNVPVGEFTFIGASRKKAVLGSLRMDGYKFDKNLFNFADQEIAELLEKGELLPEDE